MFKNSKVEDGGTTIWKNTKGYDVKTKSYWIVLPSMDEVSLECYDEHKKMNITDSLIISIYSKEFAEWLYKTDRTCKEDPKMCSRLLAEDLRTNRPISIKDAQKSQ